MFIDSFKSNSKIKHLVLDDGVCKSDGQTPIILSFDESAFTILFWRN